MVTCTRLTRVQRREAKVAAIERLTSAARSAESRAQAAETRNLELQARMLEQTGSSDAGSAGDHTLAVQIADRLSCIAPRLQTLLQEDERDATARRNVALHNAALPGLMAELPVQQVRKRQRGFRRQRPTEHAQVQHFSIGDAAPEQAAVEAAAVADAIMHHGQRIAQIEMQVQQLVEKQDNGADVLWFDSMSDTGSDEEVDTSKWLAEGVQDVATIGFTTGTQPEDGRTLCNYNILKASGSLEADAAGGGGGGAAALAAAAAAAAGGIHDTTLQSSMDNDVGVGKSFHEKTCTNMEAGASEYRELHREVHDMRQYFAQLTKETAAHQGDIDERLKKLESLDLSGSATEGMASLKLDILELQVQLASSRAEVDGARAQITDLVLHKAHDASALEMQKSMSTARHDEAWAKIKDLEEAATKRSAGEAAAMRSADEAAAKRSVVEALAKKSAEEAATKKSAVEAAAMQSADKAAAKRSADEAAAKRSAEDVAAKRSADEAAAKKSAEEAAATAEIEHLDRLLEQLRAPTSRR